MSIIDADEFLKTIARTRSPSFSFCTYCRNGSIVDDVCDHCGAKFGFSANDFTYVCIAPGKSPLRRLFERMFRNK